MSGVLNLPSNISLESKPSGEKASTHGYSEVQSANQPNTAFSSVMDEVAPDANTETGKQLPGDGAEMAKQQQLHDQSVDLLNATDSTTLRSVGDVNLILGQHEITENSLLDFMNEQGLSRSEMLALLSDSDSEKTTTPDTEAMAAIGTTDLWLRTKTFDTNLPSDALSKSIELPIELADEILLKNTLAAQLQTRLSGTQPSAIVELIATRSAAQQLTTGAAPNAQIPEFQANFFDLLDLNARQGGADSSASNPNDSSSLLSSGGRSGGESVTNQGELKDFRSFLADHLRRAETIQQLTDRLGSFVARQVTAQLSQGRWSLDLTLHPSELGSIKVDMEMTERGLEATFRASQAVTRDLLMESMPRLKQWFEEGGINVAYSGLSQDSEMNQSTNHDQEQDSADLSSRSLADAEAGSQTDEVESTALDPERLDIRV
ncbi:MAG: flagellar hook-length control protein FliK [Litoricolaceae bacterium]|nr:flagellar hook-length control protein FliK [Litorivicinaceae bacterium]